MDNKKIEVKLNEVIKEKDKLLLSLEWVIGILSCFVLFFMIIIASSTLPMSDFQRILLCLIGIVISFIGFFFALKIEQVAGYYECKQCNHKHVPTFKEVFLATHMGRTRYLKCPECQKKSWQKKVLDKE